MDAMAVPMRGAVRDTKGGYPADPGGGGNNSFTEDAPRPPVPGEEGELVCGEGLNPSLLPLYEGLKGEASVAATPRRPDLDLGYEPEGSASPTTPPYAKWAESLRSLLDDQEGIHLFARFLKREACADLLDFWFACSGFRKLEASGGANEEKKLKLAKAIYRKYVLDADGIVARRVTPPTKCLIRDRVARLRIDPAMFDQAQTEIQATMEESAYPLFLKSDVYLEYARTGGGGGGGGGESPKNIAIAQSAVAGSATVSTGHYLPTLTEGEEWRAERRESSGGKADSGEAAPCLQVAQRLLTETASQRVANGVRFQDGQECRRAALREPALSYYVNSGFAAGPAASAVDSEQQSMSSDADTISLTDSSVDGVPPYRYRKQHRREMQESAKANGRVPLPHIPRTNRIPKDIHVEPGRFAADLISRLEAVQREREAQERLEERLRRVPLEDDDDLHIYTPAPPANHRPQHGHAPPHYGLLLSDAHEENPESILDDHVQRVMKTPGCQSPGTGRHSPVKSRSPDGLSASGGGGRHGPKGDAGGHQHGGHHKHGQPREPEAEEAAAARARGGPLCGVDLYASKTRNYADGMSTTSMDPVGHSTKGSAACCKRAFKKGEDATLAPPEELERNHKILLWMMEGEKESGRHKRSTYGSAAGNNNNNGGIGISNARPSHPFVQDPTMPPNLAPNPLTQLEEVRRRLEEESVRCGAAAAAQPKQRYVMEVIQRGRTAVRPALFPPLDMVPAVSDCDLSESEYVHSDPSLLNTPLYLTPCNSPPHKTARKPLSDCTTVAYYFCGEPIPYRTSVRGRVVTLGQFKELLTKRGSYRFYFKKLSDEFDCGVVFEEVREDDAILPIFKEKIIGKVEKID
ncbi:Axin-1 [Merluccius polli]|uniref:Axin-1 n=1 Tax=Merluccius polli TaxID=89951 RepID=A0AA47PAQ2_MERPO|nr:Axin-1 [Merluccius polli]